MAWHSPFDLYYWFVNVLAGSLTIFLGISFLVIAILSGMFRMPTMITGVMFGLFVIMLSVYTGNLAILVILLIGLALGWAIMRITR